MNFRTRVVVFAVMLLLVAAMWGVTFVSKRFERVAEGVAALPARSFEVFSVVTVGTGESFANPGRRGPAVAVGFEEDLVLVGAGRGVGEALRAASIPLDQASRVLLPSLMPEDTVGLDDLILTGWLVPREAALHVTGPPGTRALVDGLLAAHRVGRSATATSWELPAAGGEVEVREIAEPAEFSVGALSVRAVPVPGGPTPTLAYRVEAGAKSVLVSNAGFGRDALVALGRDADLWVTGAVYGASLDQAVDLGIDRADVLAREAAQHLRLEDTGAVATELGTGRVVLTRLRPPPMFETQYERLVQETFRGPVTVANDAEVFEP